MSLSYRHRERLADYSAQALPDAVSGATTVVENVASRLERADRVEFWARMRAECDRRMNATLPVGVHGGTGE